MRPSASATGRAWLANFHETESPAATTLLDSLYFVTLGRLWEGLRELLASLEHAEGRTPFVVYPERHLKGFAEASDWDEDERPIAWVHFHPGEPLSIPAGSDAFVAMVLKELQTVGRRPIGGIEPSADLKQLKTARCRSIVIATDVVASGQQVDNLAGAIARNPTIRSWRSLGLVQIRVAAFAALQPGVERLEQSNSVDGFDYLQPAPTIFSIPLDDIQRDAVLALCNRHGRGGWKLGFGNAGALFVTERRAPNNVPSIFTRKGSGWSPLFPGRSVPRAFALEVGDHRSAEPLQAVAQRLGELRLGRNERVESIRQASRSLIQILALANTSPVTPAAVAASLGTDIPSARALMASLQSWGFLSGHGVITESGRSELREYRRGLRRTTARLRGSEDPYYHQGVR